MERNNALDICKGIGILLVIIGHMETPLGRVIYGFHMGLFFFLSGFCFKDSYLKDFFVFLKKRTIRLLVPYFLFPLIAFLFVPHINEVWYKAWSSSQLWDSYPSNILGTMWFLKSLFIVSILSWGGIKLFQLFKGKHTIIMPFLALVAFYLILKFTGKLSAHYIYYSVFYLMGYHCKFVKSGLFKSAQITPGILSVWGGAFLVLVIASYYSDTIIQHTDCSNFLIYFIGSMSGIYLACQISSFVNQDSIIGETLLSLGQKTMPIMIFNWAAFGILNSVFSTLEINLPNGVVYWSAQVAIAIALPISVDYLYVAAKRVTMRILFTKK